MVVTEIRQGGGQGQGQLIGSDVMGTRPEAVKVKEVGQEGLEGWLAGPDYKKGKK